MGEREYIFQSAPSPAYLRAHESYLSWIISVISLSALGFFGAFLLLGSGQFSETEALVKAQTRKLRKRDEIFSSAQRIAHVGSWP